MSNSILAQIAEIQGLGLAGLRDRWRVLYGTEAPGYSREHLVRRLAYRVQELAHGGLPDATRSVLRAVAERDGQSGQGSRLARRDANKGGPVAGTRFVREWHGEKHVVTALADGHFEYQGRIFRSLTAVARLISGGQAWGGPLFFGLKQRSRGRR